MLIMGSLRFGTMIANKHSVREGRFLREYAVPSVRIRGTKQHPTEVRHPPDRFRHVGPIWRPVIGRCTPLLRARVIFRGGEVTPRPWCLSGTPALKDSSTIYFLVARMPSAGVVSSLSGKW